MNVFMGPDRNTMKFGSDFLEFLKQYRFNAKYKGIANNIKSTEVTIVTKMYQLKGRMIVKQS